MELGELPSYRVFAFEPTKRMKKSAALGSSQSTASPPLPVRLASRAMLLLLLGPRGDPNKTSLVLRVVHIVVVGPATPCSYGKEDKKARSLRRGKRAQSKSATLRGSHEVETTVAVPCHPSIEHGR